VIYRLKSHHKEAIDKLVEEFKDNSRYLAVLIVGSIAKGMERDDSDIDIILVVSDEEYEKRKRRNRLVYFETRFCNYPGGYIDGKIINLEFLKLVAERGSEPARDAFRDAIIGFSKIPNLESLIKKITLYQKEEKSDKLRKFYAQFEIANWFIKEAERRVDNYLLTRAITDLILFGGRLILAHNEILYPFHKLFMNELKNASEKPDNLIQLIDTLLEERNTKNAQALYDAIKNFRKWDIKEFAPVRFMLDTELAWIEGKIYVGDI